MSAAGSPTADGSPAASAGQGLTGLDGAEIARRMVQAAEAAASAATAATMAVNAMSPSLSSSPATGGDWFKVLPKPGMFDPKDREAELSQFRDWWWQVEQYVVAVDPKFLVILTTFVRTWTKNSPWSSSHRIERREADSYMVYLHR